MVWVGALTPPPTPQLFRLHHQTPSAEPLRLPRLRLPGVHEARGPERGVSGVGSARLGAQGWEDGQEVGPGEQRGWGGECGWGEGTEERK